MKKKKTFDGIWFCSFHLKIYLELKIKL